MDISTTAGATSLVFLVPAVLALFLFGDRLLGLLKGEYVQSFGLLRIIALSSFPVAVYSLFTSLLNAMMKVENLVMLNALRSVLLLGLSYLLIQRYGILEAGFAWMAAYGLIASDRMDGVEGGLDLSRQDTFQLSSCRD